jgi:hypothetical protein
MKDNGRPGRKQTRHPRSGDGSPDLGLRIRKFRQDAA